MNSEAIFWSETRHGTRLRARRVHPLRRRSGPWCRWPRRWRGGHRARLVPPAAPDAPWGCRIRTSAGLLLGLYDDDGLLNYICRCRPEGTEAEIRKKLKPVIGGEGFTGRVPIEVRNLPRGVRVLNIGLNGVLVTPEQTERTITIFAESWAMPQRRRPFFAVATFEPTGTEHSSAPIRLVVEAQGSEAQPHAPAGH